MKHIKNFLVTLAVLGLSVNAILAQNIICVDGSVVSSGNGSASSPYKTIQAAVNAATNGDIIKVAQGTYSEAVKIEQKKLQLLGGFAGSGNFGTANPQANITIINGTSAAPCIYINIDKQIAGSMTISGFTISNGKRGIEFSGGWSGFLDNITIENNIIENNGSQNTNRGGGIFLEGKNVTVQKNTIRNNKAGRGAGIAASATDFLIADNLIEKNIGQDDHAGGVQVYGKGTVTRNVFDGNVIGAGPSVNYGWGWGGAILVAADDNISTNVTLSFNVYRNNTAPSRGGAVFVDDGAVVRMENELLYNNKTKSSGSAIYVDADNKNNPSTLNMFNCTVSGNATNPSGGTAMFVQSSVAHVQNCIFWNNGSDFDKTTNEGAPAPAILTVDYTLTQQGFAGTGNISSDPLFADAPNGDFHEKSTVGRYHPATGQFVKDAVNSPAIDAGNPSSDFSNEPVPNGGRINLGCYGNTSEASKSGTSVTTYAVTVNGGSGVTGSGNYAAGETVSITAGTPPAGQQFKNWTTASSGVTFADANSANTSFTMPANAVTVTANFGAVTGNSEIFSPNLKAYPNPFTDDVRITDAEGCTLLVMSTAGVAVHIQKIASPNETLRLSHLPDGVYFFCIEKDNQTKMVKMMKE